MSILNSNWEAVVLDHSLRRRALDTAAVEGIKALVTLYYDNYTDAERLEDAWIGRLLEITADCDLGQDVVFDAISEAEKAVNDAGGVRSDIDGTTHMVNTQLED